MSSTIAISILRKLSACRSSLDANCSADSFVTPSTTCATCSPKSSRILLDRVRGVLDDVVEQAGGDGHHVEPQVRQDVGDLQRVDQVRLPGPADLSLVLVGREHIGPPEQLGVGVRSRRADLLDEVLEPDHGCRCLTGLGLVWGRTAVRPSAHDNGNAAGRPKVGGAARNRA